MPDTLPHSPYLSRRRRSLAEVQHLRSPEWPLTRRLTISDEPTALDMRHDFERRRARHRSDYGLQRDAGPRSAIHRCRGHMRLLRREARSRLKAYRAHGRDADLASFQDTWARYREARTDLIESIEIFEGHNTQFLRDLPTAIARLKQFCEADEFGGGDAADRLAAYQAIAERFLGAEVVDLGAADIKAWGG